MWYSLLADVVLAVHLAYVGYVLLGLVLILVGVRLGGAGSATPGSGSRTSRRYSS